MNDIKPRKPLNKFWNRSPFFYRVRNRLLFREISVEELSRINYNRYNPKHSIPEIFFKTSELIFKDENADLTDFEKALKIATWLRNNIKGGKGLGINSEEALLLMLNGGYGICSDFSQIFNNFCVVNDIKVREWGLKKVDAHTGGHSFNEIYDIQFKKWIAMDISKSVYFTAQNNIPLTAIELFQKERKTNIKTIQFNYNYTPSETVIFKFYLSNHYVPFVIDKYVNSNYDRYLKTFKFLPIPIIHGIALLSLNSYVYKKINKNETYNGIDK